METFPQHQVFNLDFFLFFPKNAIAREKCEVHENKFLQGLYQSFCFD